MQTWSEASEEKESELRCISSSQAFYNIQWCFRVNSSPAKLMFSFSPSPFCLYADTHSPYTRELLCCCLHTSILRSTTFLLFNLTYHFNIFLVTRLLRHQYSTLLYEFENLKSLTLQPCSSYLFLHLPHRQRPRSLLPVRPTFPYSAFDRADVQSLMEPPTLPSQTSTQ